MDYMTALAAMRAGLATPELPAVLNRQEVNPPCVFITVKGLDAWTMGGCYEAALSLYVVIGDRNDEAALLALQPLLAGVLEKLEALNLPIVAIEADTVLGTDTATPYPAWRIDTHLTV